VSYLTKKTMLIVCVCVSVWRHVM